MFFFLFFLVSVSESFELLLLQLSELLFYNLALAGSIVGTMRSRISPAASLR